MFEGKEGFLTDIRGAEFFFRVCRRYKVCAYADRLRLIREIARRKRVKYVRDISILTKGKRVVRLGREGAPKTNVN